MSAPTLFDALLSHKPPHSANTDTSIEAAEAVLGRMGMLQGRVLDALSDHGPLTADEAATILCEDKLSIRPRFTELRSTNKITDTGQGRKNASGRRAIVWAVTI